MSEICYSVQVPKYMLDGPNLIHLNGLMAYPGKENDYTISDSIICWWNPHVCEMINNEEELVISIIRLDTGEKWGISNKEGIFLDTRRKN